MTPLYSCKDKIVYFGIMVRHN